MDGLLIAPEDRRRRVPGCRDDGWEPVAFQRRTSRREGLVGQWEVGRIEGARLAAKQLKQTSCFFDGQPGI